LAARGHIDVFYADESRVSTHGYVPYGWPYRGEEPFIPSTGRHGHHAWALFSRDNRLHYATTPHSINSAFVYEQLDYLSLHLTKPTAVVLDNASIHTAKCIHAQRPIWEQRGLTLFYLPPYSPHLNWCERLWRELKARWLKADDYMDAHAWRCPQSRPRRRWNAFVYSFRSAFLNIYLHLN
jgi:transposase